MTLNIKKNSRIIPNLDIGISNKCIESAYLSPRNRFAHILHSPGDEFNRVFNFMLKNSYMQPHLHSDKIEDIFLIKGQIAILFFDDGGKIISVNLLNDNNDHVCVPSYTWHTYVILTDMAVTYETMIGVYSPETWKKMSSWSPAEGDVEHEDYLGRLKEYALQNN